MSISSKLTGSGADVSLPIGQIEPLVMRILTGKGLIASHAEMVARHLVEADLAGVASHGCFRTIEYARQFSVGILNPTALPALDLAAGGATLVDGHGGIGIPAMHLAVDHLGQKAQETGLAALGIRNVGHTGRIGAFAEMLAHSGHLCIIIGGGGREKWRQVAPFGGAKAILPTNPYAMAIPGGDNGPVVMDFATAAVAGGWIYAAKATGASLPQGVLLDKDGQTTTDPNAYFDGGAILPFGGPKGSAMSVMAEMIGEAMLGPSTTECQWLMIALDTKRFREPSAMQSAAEEVLGEIRNCPTAPGFDQVWVPGERERAAAKGQTHITLPAAIWEQIKALA